MRSFSNLLILKNDDAFNKQKELPGKKILYFTASWCPPCKAIAPVFESLSKKYPALNFVKIDVDNLPETAQDFGIRSVPTFVFVNGQKQVSQVCKILLCCLLFSYHFLFYSKHLYSDLTFFLVFWSGRTIVDQ